MSTTTSPQPTQQPTPQNGQQNGQPATPGLSHGLRPRHLSMIALGGVIGAGLFVGSGAGIAAAGPAIVLAFAVSGVLVMLIMRMLGEMSAARPASGSFSVHAEKEIGVWAGFTSGWLFWLLLCVGVSAEATGAAGIMTSWLPGTPTWVWVALFMTFFCVSNLAAVKNFGEFEFWFAAIKVAAIVGFLVLGVLAILGVIGKGAPGLTNLTGQGGFLPHGVNGLVTGLLASVFAYGGLETVTIAAAESKDPVRSVGSAVRTAMWRIAVFYVGSMAVIVTLLPWNNPSVVKNGPYVETLSLIGVPAAAQIMNVVVLIALLSAMNANIYGSSRMAYSLVQRGLGPKALAKVNGGVPRLAVLASSAFGFFAVLLNFWWPTTVFAWLLNAVGAAVLVVWAFVCVAQLRMRKRLEREAPSLLTVRMWAFPYLTWVALAGVVAVLGLMLLSHGNRVELATTLGATAVLAVLGLAWSRKK